jgi:methionine synthase II (cobalamin-independent)
VGAFDVDAGVVHACSALVPPLSVAGPVTILNWSFPRKDISRAAQAAQLALALRQEVDALQTAGCRIIQVRQRPSLWSLVQGSRHALSDTGCQGPRGR